MLFEGLQSPSLYQYTDDKPPASADALRERYLKLGSGQSPDGSERWLNWAVWSDPDARYIGYVQATIGRDGGATIAYVFFPDVWGRGYAHEAVESMAKHLLAEYQPRVLRAYVDPQNLRSITLLEKLGFVRTPSTGHVELGAGERRPEVEYMKVCEASRETPRPEDTSFPT